MPLHDFRCPNGHTMEAMVPAGVDWITCQRCLEKAEKIFLKFPGMYVSMDICYDSPIDGRPITNKQARIEDLARNHCRPYDPTEKDAAIRNRKAADEKLEKQLDSAVDETLAGWSPRKKELLEQEVRAGATAEIVRKTPNGS